MTDQQNSQKNSIPVNLFWQKYQMMPNSWVTVVNQELNTCLSAALRSISSEISPRIVKALLLRFTPFKTLRRACIWYPVGSGSWVVSHWWLTKITNIPACKGSVMLCFACEIQRIGSWNRLKIHASQQGAFHWYSWPLSARAEWGRGGPSMSRKSEICIRRCYSCRNQTEDGLKLFNTDGMMGDKNLNV